MNNNSIENTFPRVSIVIVGQNEGRNLHDCFSAIQMMNYPKDKLEIIYVDSYSKDNSVEIAFMYTEKVYQERSIWPTAGEAFNRGILEATAEIVHITAGDIQLHPEYLKKAVETLQKMDNIQAVTGYFYEKNPKGWNKIISYRREEDTVKSDHFVDSPNGGTFRKKALIAVNGYDERIKKGQETDLGKRFKEMGYKIWYMNIPQGVHDFELNSFKDMVSRTYNLGFSLGHLFLLSYFEKNNENLKQFKNSAIKSILINGFLLTLLFLMIILGGPIFSAYWIILYFTYHTVRVLFKQKKKTPKHKIYYLITGYFWIWSFIGIIGFFMYYFRLKIKKENLMRPKIGLKREIN